MKYFGGIALICIFQSIHLSLACFDYDVGIVSAESGLLNNLKMLNGMHFELSDDCILTARSSLTLERPYTSATISVQAKNEYMDLWTIKHEDLCKFASNYSLSGFECPSLKPGRSIFEMHAERDISEYGPFLPLFEGKITVLFKVNYDGDSDNPDLLKAVINIKPKNPLTEWTF